MTSINIAVSAISNNWNPFEGAITGLVNISNSPLYDPLWAIDFANAGVDDAGVPRIATPWLAESFEISEDRKLVTVRLREDVSFVDGVHLDAPGLEKYLDALFASPNFAWKAHIVDRLNTQVTATGEYTLEMTTTEVVDLGWLAQIGYTPIASPSVVDDPSILADGPVGSGGYTITDYVPDVSITFERAPDYWNSEAFDFDTVTLTVYTDTVAALNALKTGQVDVAQLTPELASEAEASDLVVFESVGRFESLYIDDRSGSVVPALADVRVRQAMNLAFDKEAILENLNGSRGTAGSQPFTPGQPEYVEGADDRYAYDLERARELMVEAGYPDGFDLTIPLAPSVAHVGPVVQQSLADIGIRVTFDNIPEDELYTIDWKSGEYAVGITSWGYSNTLGAVYYIFGGYREEEAAALYDAIYSGSFLDAVDSMQELARMILDEAWYVPFSHPSAVFAAVPGIEVRLGGIEALPDLIS